MVDLFRVAVIDDQPLFREGVVKLFSSVHDFEVVGEGSSAADARKIAEEYAPDVMLLEVQVGNGVEAASVLMRAHPNMRIIVLTASEDEQHVAAALKAGAK